MSDNDLTLRIRADASQVQSGTDAAKGAVKSLSSSAQSDAAVMAAGFASLNASLRTINQSLVTLTDQTRRAADAAHGLKSYVDMGYVIAALGVAFTGLKDIVEGSVWTVSAINHAHDAAIASSIKYAASLGYVTTAVYNLETANASLAGRTVGIPVRMIEDLSAWAQRLMGVSAASDRALVRTAAVDESLGKLAATAKAAGLNTASDALSKFVVALEQVPGVTEEVGVAIENTFLRIPSYTAQMNNALVVLTANLSKSREEAQAWAADLSGAMTDPATNGAALLTKLGPETSSAYSKQLTAATDVNDMMRAQGILLEAVVSHIQRAVTGDKQRLADLEKQAAQWSIIGRWSHDIADAWRNVFGSEEVHSSQLQADADAAERLKDVIDKIGESMKRNNLTIEQFGKNVQDILTSDKSKFDEEETARKIAILRTGIKGATDDAAEFIQRLESVNVEGFNKPYLDKSQGDPKKDHWAVGYGQHSVLGQNVTENSSFSEDEINQDFKNRITDMRAFLETQLGEEAWAKISGAAKASLADVFYNYGHLPSGVLAAGKTGDNVAIANAILGLQDDNGGQNKARRQTDYANIMYGLKPLSASDKESAGALLPQLGDAALRHSEKDDGTQVEQQKELQLNDKILGNKQDELENAKDIAESARQDLVNAQNAQASDATIRARKKALAEADADVDAKTLAVAMAQADAAIAAAKNNPAALRDAKIAKADLKENGVDGHGGYEEGTAQYIAAEQEKKDAIREFTEYQKKTSAEAEDAAYHNATQGLAQRKQVLEEEQQEGLITKQEMFAGEQAIEADRTALEKAHWQKLETIWGQGTAQYRDAQKHLTEVDADAETKRAAITRQSNAEIHADYMKVTEQIANTMSSSIMGMIQGTSSLRSMLRQITLDIIKMFLDAGLKMVANWAAQQLQMVVFSVTGEQEITAAKVLGVAQRTAAGAAGAAADVATTATAIVRSIMSSAAEAFAGVFGFLAPILGPAAVGPATAAMATVSGVANVVAHDVGAWEIPSDHLAIVHQGETIMTASQGAAFRSAMNMISNGTAGGLGSPQKPGGENHFHFNVSSPDASGVQDWFGSNSRQIMKAMNQAVKDGNHLGLRRLAGA